MSEAFGNRLFPVSVANLQPFRTFGEESQKVTKHCKDSQKQLPLNLGNCFNFLFKSLFNFVQPSFESSF